MEHQVRISKLENLFHVSEDIVHGHIKGTTWWYNFHLWAGKITCGEKGQKNCGLGAVFVTFWADAVHDVSHSKFSYVHILEVCRMM